MRGGDNTDAKVQLLVADGDFDATVLRTPPFGDIHLGKDFYAGNYRPEEAAGRTVAFVQNTIDPVANSDDFLEWLDMDIRGPEKHGLLNHELDETDDRGTVLIDHFAGPDGAGSRGFGLGEVDFRVGKLLQDRVGRFAFNLAVVLIDGFQDLVARGE